MQRKSFWISQETPQHPMLRGRVKTDVAVAGGGLTGLACALWLRRAGLEVALVEAECIGGGTSAHCAGIVSLSNGLLYRWLETTYGVDTVNHYAQTQQSAIRAVESLVHEGGQAWNEISARLSGGVEQDIDEEASAMKRAGLQAEMKKQDGRSMIELPRAAVIHPAEYLHMLARLAAQSGVKIYEKSRVVTLETNQIHTERGSVEAPYLIIATGYPIINVPGWYFLKIQQRKCALVPLAGEMTFDGVWIDANGKFALRPLARGALMQYVSGYAGERDHQEQSGRSISKLAEAFGMIADEKNQMSLECYTPDGLPYIGQYGKKTPNLFVASGYGGRGIVGSMVAAQAISARILGLPSDGYEIYSGQRSMKGIHVPLSIAARYTSELIKHPSAPRCPHMGCRLVYNAVNRIWECPCHGSRFDDIGHVINAPSVRDAILENRKTKRS